MAHQAHSTPQFFRISSLGNIFYVFYGRHDDQHYLEGMYFKASFVMRSISPSGDPHNHGQEQSSARVTDKSFKVSCGTSEVRMQTNETSNERRSDYTFFIHHIQLTPEIESLLGHNSAFLPSTDANPIRSQCWRGHTTVDVSHQAESMRS